MNKKTKQVSFDDIAKIERSKKNKIYSNCILLQLSASDGQLFYIKEPQTVEDKYGVIQLTVDWINTKYLFIVLEMVMPDFLSRYQNGININPNVLKHLEFNIHTDRKTQAYVIELVETIEELEKLEAKELDCWKSVKKFYNRNCFV